MKNLKHLLLSFLLLVSTHAFTQNLTDKGLDFAYEQGKGTLNEVDNMTSIRVLSNLNVPKAIFMLLMDEDPQYKEYSALNGEFATDLYEIVYKINKNKNLKDTTEGIDQDIDFIIAGSPDRIEKVMGMIEKRLKTADSLKYFQSIFTQNLVPEGLNLDRWMQDWGEFIGTGFDSSGNEVSGVYYVNRGRGLENIVKEISMMMNVPFIRSESFNGSGGNYGGNIESTPDGTLYFGDTMAREQEYQLTKLNPTSSFAKLDTSWLAVGHVDEHMSVIPSVNTTKYPESYKGPKANYATVFADPMWGLKLIRDYKGTQKYITYLSEYLPEFNMTNIVPENDQAYYDIKTLKKAINWFDNNEQIFEKTISTRRSKTLLSKCSLGARVHRRYCDLVLANVFTARIIDNNIAIYKANTPAIDEIVMVPQIYRQDYYQDQSGQIRDGGQVSFLPGTANMVVLRDNLIVPEITFDGYQAIVHEQLAKIVGGKDKVHFIMEKAEYHDLYGEVHCGTNVLREIDLMIPNIK